MINLYPPFTKLTVSIPHFTIRSTPPPLLVGLPAHAVGLSQNCSASKPLDGEMAVTHCLALSVRAPEGTMTALAKYLTLAAVAEMVDCDAIEMDPAGMFVVSIEVAAAAGWALVDTGPVAAVTSNQDEPLVRGVHLPGIVRVEERVEELTVDRSLAVDDAVVMADENLAPVKGRSPCYKSFEGLAAAEERLDVEGTLV